jgi:hypothetical protein
MRNAADDPDGDGVPNGAEMAAGTDPTDPLSALRMLSIQLQEGGVRVEGQFSSVPGRWYWVESTGNLTGSWKTATGLLYGTESSTAWQAVGGSNGFFRAVVVDPAGLSRSSRGFDTLRTRAMP